MKKFFFTIMTMLWMMFPVQAQITEFPYSPDFDSYEVWEEWFFNDWWFPVSIYDGMEMPTPHSGNWVIETYWDEESESPDDWIISTAIVLPDSGTMELSWYDLTLDPDNPVKHYSVYISSDEGVFTDEDIVFEITLGVNDTGWNYRSVSLADYAGETIYVAFHHYNCSNDGVLCIDDILIDELSLCNPPTNITVTNITSESAIVEWTLGSDAIGVEIFVDGESQGVQTGGSYSIMGLQPGSTHSVTIVGLCSQGGTSGVGSISFSTPCVPISEFPWSDGFEENNVCWTYDGDYWEVHSYDAHGGNRALFGDFSTGSNCLITPVIAVPADVDGMQAEFYIRGSYYNVNYKIWVSTSGATMFDSSVFSLVMDTSGTNEYARMIVPLENYAGQNVTIAFENTSTNTYLIVDDFTVRSANMPIISIESPESIESGTPATFVCHMVEGDSANVLYTWSSSMQAAGLATMSSSGSALSINYYGGGEDTVEVSVDNGYGTATATAYIHIRHCPVVSIPWVDSMDNASSMECWVIPDGLFWHNTSFGYLQCNFLQGRAVTPAIYIPTPDECSDPVLSWDVRSDSNGNHVYYTNYMVLVSPYADTSTDAFTDTIFSEVKTGRTWSNRTVYLNQYAGQEIRCAFVVDETPSTYYSCYLDNVGVRPSLQPHVSVREWQMAVVGEPVVINATLNGGSLDGLTYTWNSAMENAGYASSTDVDGEFTITYSVYGIDTITVVVSNIYGSDTAMTIVEVPNFAPVTDLPYFTGFESEQDVAWWFNNEDNHWTIGEAVNNGGSQSLYITDGFSGQNFYTNYVASNSFAYRAFSLESASDYILSFDWRAYGEIDNDYLLVYLVPPTLFDFNYHHDIGLPEGFTILGGGTFLNLENDWQSNTSSFHIEDSGVYLLVFLWHNNSQMGMQPPAAIDNVSLTKSTCPIPSGLTVDTITGNTIEFHWNAQNEGTTWLVTIGDNAPILVSDTFYMATGLEANTDYTISVCTSCGDADTSFCHTTMAHTECGNVSVPYTQGFEATGESCWNILNYTGGNYTFVTSTHTHTGNRSHYFCPVNDGPIFAVMPPVEDIGDKKVNFWYYGDPLCNMVVGTMTDPYDTSTFTPINYIDDINFTTWREHEMRLAGAPEGDHYVAFRFDLNVVIEGAAGGVYLDDVSLTASAGCDRPQEIFVVAIDSNNATIVIHDSTAVDNYRIVLMNNDGDTLTDYTILDSIAFMVGLTPNTRYTVSVSTRCDDGSETSSLLADFVTSCTPITMLPWSETFDLDEEFACWRVFEYGTPAVMLGYTFKSWSLENGSVSSLGNNYNANDWLITPSVRIPDDAESIILGFDIQGVPLLGASSYYPHVTVRISVVNTGVNEEDFASIAMDDTLTESGYISHAFPLDLFAGQTIRVAFIHNSCYDQGVYLDNVYIGVGTATDTLIDVVIPEPPIDSALCFALTPVITECVAIDTDKITLVWASDASDYEVAITEGEWSAPINVEPTSSHSYVFSNLSTATQYSVGVRAHCNDSLVSPWVTATIYTRDPRDGIAGVDVVSFLLYPNPASAYVTIMPSSPCTVRLLDLTGKLCNQWELVNEAMTINIGSYARGTYFMQVVDYNGVSVRKLVLQ